MRRRGDQIMHGTVVDADTTSHLLVSVHGQTVGAVAAASPGLPVPGDPVTLVRADRRLLALPGYTLTADVDAYLRFNLGAVPYAEGADEGWDFENSLGSFARIIDGSDDSPGDWNTGDDYFGLLSEAAVLTINDIAVQAFDMTPWWSADPVRYPAGSYGSEWDDFPALGSYAVTAGGDWSSVGLPFGSVNGKQQDEYVRTLVWGVYVYRVAWTTLTGTDAALPTWSLAVDTFGAASALDGVRMWTARVDAGETLEDAVGEQPGFTFDVIEERPAPGDGVAAFPFAAVIVHDQ